MQREIQAYYVTACIVYIVILIGLLAVSIKSAPFFLLFGGLYFALAGLAIHFKSFILSLIHILLIWFLANVRVIDCIGGPCYLAEIEIAVRCMAVILLPFHLLLAKTILFSKYVQGYSPPARSLRYYAITRGIFAMALATVTVLYHQYFLSNLPFAIYIAFGALMLLWVCFILIRHKMTAQ